MESEEATNPGAEEDVRVETEPEVGTEAETETTDQVEDIDPETGEPRTPAADDDTDEIEHAGQKYKIPKAVKPLLMMQADYTKKTQEVAESRKALETERSTWQAQQTERAEVVQKLQEDVGRVYTLKSQLAEFDKVPWVEAFQAAAASDDPARESAKVNAAFAQYRALQAEAETAEKSLTEKTEKLRLDAERETATRMEETGKVLARDIEGWGEERFNSLVSIAKSEGVTPEEMHTWDDPRAWKLLNRLHLTLAENQKLQTQLKSKTTVDRHAASAGSQPAATVRSGGVPATGAPRDDMPIEEWVKRERERVARKNQRRA